MQANVARLSSAIDLTEEEAFALLTLCIMSQHDGDKVAESALRKLADYCKHSFLSSEESKV